MSIDLACRPKGASHFATEGRGGCWYKQENGQWFFMDMIDDEDGDARIWTPCVGGPAMPPVELPDEEPEPPEPAATGGPAFPCHTNPRPGQLADAPLGMTLRDYFAAKCCAAMVSTIRNDGDYMRLRNVAESHDLDSVSQFFAREAYKQADAMLAARGEQ